MIVATRLLPQPGKRSPGWRESARIQHPPGAARHHPVGMNRGERVTTRSSGAEGNGVNELHETQRQARAFRRLRRSFASTNGYGLVLELLIVTYVLAVTLSAQWGRRSCFSLVCRADHPQPAPHGRRSGGRHRCLDAKLEPGPQARRHADRPARALGTDKRGKECLVVLVANWAWEWKLGSLKCWRWLSSLNRQRLLPLPLQSC